MSTVDTSHYDGWSAKHFAGPVYKRMICAHTQGDLAALLLKEAKLAGWKPRPVEPQKKRPGPLTPAELQYIKENNRLGSVQLARRMGRSPVTVRKARDSMRLAALRSDPVLVSG